MCGLKYAVSMTDKPNIVFIFTDQQRADTFGYAGDPVAITPHADRLAAEGVVFRAVVQVRRFA